MSILANEEKAFIKVLRQNNVHGMKKIVVTFPDRNWTLSAINFYLKKVEILGPKR